MVRVLVVLLAGGELLEASPSRVALTKQCGERQCSLLQYCSDHMCHDCADACEKSHNYDESTCNTQCQEYMHDKRSDALSGIQGTVDGLKVSVAISLSVSCLAALGLLALVFYLCLRRNIASPTNKKESELHEKKMAVSAIFNNNKVEKEKELHLDMPPTGAPSVVTTTTPISTRHPSEDTTLEYAYDNPNLTPSPQLPQPRHETTF